MIHEWKISGCFAGKSEQPVLKKEHELFDELKVEIFMRNFIAKRNRFRSEIFENISRKENCVF